MIAVMAGVAISTMALADDAKPTVRKITPVPTSKMAEYNAKTGGLVEPPAKSKVVVLLDARSDSERPSMTNFIASAERMLMVRCERRTICLTGTDCPRKIAIDAKKAGAGAVVLFYERSGDPTLTVFPEDAVALVNMLPLKSPDKSEMSRRFSKEFWRSLGFALGAYGSEAMGSSLVAVYSLPELDAVRGFGLSPQQLSAVHSVKSRLGMFGKRAVPYSRACREGWAPAPTNAVQRSLYKRFMDPTSRFKEDFGK